MHADVPGMSVRIPLCARFARWMRTRLESALPACSSKPQEDCLILVICGRYALEIRKKIIVDRETSQVCQFGCVDVILRKRSVVWWSERLERGLSCSRDIVLFCLLGAVIRVIESCPTQIDQSERPLCSVIWRLVCVIGGRSVFALRFE